MAKPITPIAERVFEQIKKSIWPNGCWEYAGSHDKDGYGVTKDGGRRGSMVRVHRLVYEIMVGDIPEGLSVLHNCDNTGCVNPKHLFVGTQADNMHDMIDKGRSTPIGATGVSHHNAKLTEENVEKIRSSKLTLKELAEEFGVSFQTISEIKLEKKWKHYASQNRQTEALHGCGVREETSRAKNPDGNVRTATRRLRNEKEKMESGQEEITGEVPHPKHLGGDFSP